LSNGKALFDFTPFSNEACGMQFWTIAVNNAFDGVVLRTVKRTNSNEFSVSQQEFRYTQQNSRAGASKFYF
jgi:hypothetical protein